MYGFFAEIRKELAENTNFQVFQGFPALKETVAHIQPNGQNFLPKWAKRDFFQKSVWNIFSLLKDLIN